MNNLTLIEGVEIALRKRPFSKSGTWILIYDAKTFQAVPTNQYIGQAPDLLKFRETDAELGFKPKQWDLIAKHLEHQFERITK